MGSPGAPGALTGRSQGTAVRLALAGGLVAATAWVLGRPEPLALGGDNETLLHPLFVDVVRQVRAGVVPLWTTGRWGGAPLIGDPVSGAMYPLNYLGYVLTPFPHRHAMDVAACVHLAVFATGMAWCARRLGARPLVALVATALAAASPTFVYVARSWTSWWAAISWWPWLLGAALAVGRGERRRGLAVVSLAAQVYAGYPQFALYSGLVALAVLLLASEKTLRARLADVLVVVGGGLGLAAPQLLPGLAMAEGSMRLGPGGAARLAALDVAAIPPAAWWNVVGPGATLGRLPVKVAPVVLVLAAIGLVDRRPGVRVLGAAAVAAALAAGGPALLMRVLHALPLFDFFAGPFKFVYVAVFLAHTLAAVGLERVAVAPPVRRRLAAAALALAAAPSVGWPAFLGVAAAALPARAVFGGATALVLCATASFFARTAPLATPQPFGRDAFTPLLRASPADATASPADRWIALDEDTAVRQTGMNFGALWGLQSISGVGPLPPWREFEVLGAGEAGRAPALVREMGASRVVVRARSGLERTLADAGFRRIGGLDGLSVLAAASPAPPVFLAGAVERVTAADAVAAARRGTALDVERVLVEATPEGTTEAGDPAGRLEVLASGPTAYRMRVDVDRPTWVITRVPYYRNWRATIDDRPAEIRPAGAMFLGVRAGAGRHELALRYTEPGLVTGLAIAAATALALAILRART